MNCAEAKSRLTSTPPQALAGDTALRAHLESCADCRDLAAELRLSKGLRELPVPPASEGFADRALARAWDSTQAQPARSSAPYAWMGLAASVLIALAVVFLPGESERSDLPIVAEVPPPATPVMRVLQVEANEVRPVTLRLVSKDALPEATVTIHLDGVALDGYPEQNTLSWQTSIAAGSNHLSLPVELLNRAGGNILIEIKSGNAKKQMQLALEAKPLPQA